MNRLEKHFTELQKRHEKALILYITAGDPDMAATLNIMQALAENGVDCIELGIPFSDPMADGPVIQRASARALLNNINLRDILSLVKTFRQTHQTPVVLMGYFNTILHFGPEAFLHEYRAAGGDGLIIADLPFEEGEHFESLCREHSINLIYLVSPEPGTERTRNILAATGGFVYCVSHYGITGQHTDNNQLDNIVRSLKSMTTLPIAVGFGISSVEQAQQAARSADGVIIGSWLISELEQAQDKKLAAAGFCITLKEALTLV
ncbi:MAG TPA: tryptophan synthase subunit alpha [bacterium]|nr:tryptophan synthase subunit alpha [bacterium]HPN42391.1 tryptophan synthase subunit alpha [bacterium]